ADRFVLVGDHQQLPPVVQSADTASDGTSASDDSAAARSDGGHADVQHPSDPSPSGGSGRAADLSRSLFERLAAEHPDASVLLDTQYRMAQRIEAYSSQEFY